MDAESLAARIAQLETEVSRQQVLHQRLAVAKGRIDRELQRFQAIQLYVQRAVLVESLTELRVLTLEAIVEAFEFEVALFLAWDGQLTVAHAFGFEQDLPATLPFEEGWVAAGTSRILEGDNPRSGRVGGARAARCDPGTPFQQGRCALRHARRWANVGAWRVL